jgi:2-octaprenyl-6-methoxyphenol hydroxylase
MLRLTTPTNTLDRGSLAIVDPPSLACDVAIVGGGIIGYTLALALQSTGLRITLIEAQAESVAVAKSRAYVLSVLSGRIFDRLGIWHRIQPQLSAFQQIQISDADSLGVVTLHPADLGAPDLGYGVSHGVLLTALQEKLQEYPEKFACLCPQEVVGVEYLPEEAIVRLKSPTDSSERILHAKTIVAADGANSPLRHQANIQTRGWKYWQSCVTLTVKPSIPHESIAYERFWYDGPMGVIPLPDGNCQIVWTSPHKIAQELLHLGEQEFLHRLKIATGGKLGEMTIVTPRFLFPVKLMQSGTYVSHRLALVGDAAHCCHPVAGQGMNLGIRDTIALADTIRQAVAAGEDIGTLGVLKRYQRQRQPENLAILAFTDFLNRLFSNRFLPIVFLRRLGLKVLANLPFLKSLSLRIMTGVAFDRYGES